MARTPLDYLAAAAIAAPVGALAWFALLYLAFGLTGRDLTPVVNLSAAALAFGVAFGWPLRGARRPAEVLRRGCRLGVAVAASLPLVAFAVLLLWEASPGRRDLGMGGLMLYAMPFVALGVGGVLALVFWIAGGIAGRRLEREDPA